MKYQEITFFYTGHDPIVVEVGKDGVVEIEHIGKGVVKIISDSGSVNHIYTSMWEAIPLNEGTGKTFSF